MKHIDIIASLITEDPDVINELQTPAPRAAPRPTVSMPKSVQPRQSTPARPQPTRIPTQIPAKTANARIQAFGQVYSYAKAVYDGLSAPNAGVSELNQVIMSVSDIIKLPKVAEIRQNSVALRADLGELMRYLQAQSQALLAQQPR